MMASRRGALAGAEDYLSRDEDPDPRPSTSILYSKEEYEAEDRAIAAKHASTEAVARERAAQAAHRTRGAQASADAAERRNKGSLSATMRPATRFVSRKASRRVLVAELALAASLKTLGKITQGTAPGMSDYVPLFVVFLILGFAAETSDDAAHLAAGLGGLVLLVIALQAAPALVGLGDYLSGGSRSAATSGSATDLPSPAVVSHHPAKRPGVHRGNTLRGGGQVA